MTYQKIRFKYQVVEELCSKYGLEQNICDLILDQFIGGKTEGKIMEERKDNMFILKNLYCPLHTVREYPNTSHFPTLISHETLCSLTQIMNDCKKECRKLIPFILRNEQKDIQTEFNEYIFSEENSTVYKNICPNPQLTRMTMLFYSCYTF